MFNFKELYQLWVADPSNFSLLRRSIEEALFAGSDVPRSPEEIYAFVGGDEIAASVVEDTLEEWEDQQ